MLFSNENKFEKLNRKFELLKIFVYPICRNEKEKKKESKCNNGVTEEKRLYSENERAMVNEENFCLAVSTFAFSRMIKISFVKCQFRGKCQY